MATYIALFRGINVGGNHLLPMKDLVALLEKLGCGNVATYIQSGNVVFTSAEKKSPLAKKINAQVLKLRGFDPNVLLLEKSELETAARKNPFSTEVGKALHFFFLYHKPEKPNLQQLTALQSASEQFYLDETFFFLFAPDGIGHSKLAVSAEKYLGVPATARNYNTVAKLLLMCGSEK